MGNIKEKGKEWERKTLGGREKGGGGGGGMLGERG